MEPFFSILVVCLNPGDKLGQTLESIEKQTFRDFEVIVKDGLSSDGSMETASAFGDRWKETGGCLKTVSRKDKGIYDAMNQAAEAAEGRYVYYLNCGDYFYSEDVLEQMAGFIRDKEREGGFLPGNRAAGQETPLWGKTAGGWPPGIYYGDIYERQTKGRVASNPHMDAFGCYRNVPCHQACFYARALLKAHPFDTKYQVRADYEQFLWCFFEGGASCGVTFNYVKILIADYEGGGFSESGENRKVSAKEHREITKKYMSFGQLLKFRLIMMATFSGLRSKLAENEKTAKIYNCVKEKIYMAIHKNRVH